MRDHLKAPAAVRTSLHERIFTDIKDRIISGELSPGQGIPSEMKLASTYSCSRMTINKALTRLARDGYVERRRRAGTFVRRPQVQSAILEIPDIKTEVAALNVPYRYSLLDCRSSTNDDLNYDRLGISPSDPILNVTCLHYADGTPFCLEKRLINLTAVPDAGHVDFSTISPGTWLLQQVPWQEAEHTITAIGADRELADLLEISENSPCLSVERRTWNSDHIVTLVRIIYPAASHSLVARFSPS